MGAAPDGSAELPERTELPEPAVRALASACSLVADKDSAAEPVTLHKPERGLPPQEPEALADRPCRCAVCRDVPAPAAGAARSGCTAASQGASGPTFVGVYPRGLGFLALAEVSRAGATVLEHLEEHCALLFRPPPSTGSEGMELSTFELLFELLGTAVSLPPAPAVADIGAAAEKEVRATAELWRSRLRPFSRWRVSVHRNHLTHRYKAPEVVPVIGDALAAVGAISLAVGCTAGPVVDLTGFEMEVVAYLSDGIDKLRAASDTKGRASLGGKAELLLLGVRCPGAACRPAALVVEKGAVLSRADDTVAFCVAQRVADLLSARPGAAPGAREGTALVLDPMCGVGTYLLALRWVLARREVPGLCSAQLLGVDIDEESVGHLQRNAGRVVDACRLAALCASSAALPIRDAAVDLIVVDPPWGQRHSSHNYVKQFFPRWAREWARVLKPGGIAVVVTICKKVFEDQVLPPLQRQGLLVLEEAVQFDNKGWTVCRLYVVRKPLAGAKVSSPEDAAAQAAAEAASHRSRSYVSSELLRR